MQNGYPENLVNKTINSMRDKAKATTVEKKGAYITLPFKGDSVAQLITRRLTKGIEETYKAAKLFIHFSSTYLGTSQLKDKIPCFTTSFCVYSFIHVPVEHRISGVLQGDYLIECVNTTLCG